LTAGGYKPTRRADSTMEFDGALRRADARRAELAAEWKLALRWPDRPDQPHPWFTETEWCWYFCYEVEPDAASEPREFFGGGPIVVNKDGSEVWLVNSCNPLDQLAAYAEEHGFTVDPAWL
jgi:hypothetical protein